MPEPRATAGPAAASGSQRLRVALEVASLDRGGLETVVSELVRRLPHHAIDALVVCTESGGETACRLRSEGFEVAVLGSSDKAAELRDWLVRREIGLLNPHFSTLGTPVAAELGIPVVVTLHNAYAWLGRSVLGDLRALDPLVAGYVAVSESVADFCARRFAIDRDRIAVARNPVRARPATEPSARAAARAELDIPEDAELLVQVGRIDPVKCQLALVDAVAELAPSRPRLLAWMVGGVGEAAYARRVEERVSTKGLDGRVVIAGERDDVARVLAAADVFVQASVLEGLSLAALEALAAGVPAVLTRTGDAAFLLGDERGFSSDEGARSGGGGEDARCGARGGNPSAPDVSPVLPGALVEGPEIRPEETDGPALYAIAAQDHPPHAPALARAVAEVLADLPARRPLALARGRELAALLDPEHVVGEHARLLWAAAIAGGGARLRRLGERRRSLEAELARERVAEEEARASALAHADAVAAAGLATAAAALAASATASTRRELTAARVLLEATTGALDRALDKLRITHRVKLGLAALARRLRP